MPDPPPPTSPAGKVSTAFCSFTEVTDPSEHRAYNAWHQLDHLPEQLPLPGVHGGTRWVSTPACRAVRSASDPELDAVDYCTLYLMGEPIAQTLDGFFALAGRLRDEDRFHRHRRAHRAGALRVAAAVAAPRVLVSAAAVPHRPHAGVWVALDDGADAGRLAAVRAARIAALDAAVAVDGCAGAWVLDSLDGPVPGDRSRLGPHVLTVAWCDAPPLAVAPALAATFPTHDDGDRVRTLLAGPFETIVPGSWDWFDAPRPPGRRQGTPAGP